MSYLQKYTATEIGQMIQSGKVSVKEVVKYSLQEAQNDKCNAYISIDEKAALNKADQIQNQIRLGIYLSPLAGVPYAVKDNICVERGFTTCGSNMLSNYKSPYSATVIDRLEKAGAILIGKTNMDEFAMGNTSETSYYGAVTNPHNKNYVSGGSSGGMAAAVAGKSCFFGLGSDTGGSVRQPASFCGVVGLKPTYGRVSRNGLIAYASSLDQIGPITRDVRDNAVIFDIISSYDKKDGTSNQRSVEHSQEGLGQDIKGMRIGIPTDYYTNQLDSTINEKIKSVIQILKNKGAIIEEFSLDLKEYLVPTYYIIASAEASSNLARFDGIHYGYCTNEYEGIQEMYYKTRSEGFGREVKRRIMLGSFLLSKGYYEEYYQQAMKSRILIKESFNQAFANYDILITPVTNHKVPKLGEITRNPIHRYQEDENTIAANLAGIPAMSIPCGTDENGLPIGVQFMANAYEEKKLIQVADAYERERG